MSNETKTAEAYDIEWIRKAAEGEFIEPLISCGMAQRILNSIEAAPAPDGESERCSHCDCDKIYSGPPDCPRCGAPVCCEICCKEQALKDRIEQLEATIKRIEAVGFEVHDSWGVSEEFNSGWIACRAQVELALLGEAK